MVPPRRRAGASWRSAAVGRIGIEVSEACEGRRLARTRPAVPLNIAARCFSLLLYTWCVFCRKSRLARLPHAPHPDDAVLPPDSSWTVSRRALCPLMNCASFRSAVVLGAAAACALDVGDGPAAPCAQSNRRLRQHASAPVAKVVQVSFRSFAFFSHVAPRLPGSFFTDRDEKSLPRKLPRAEH